ncbi:MAG: hypothetical protein ACTSRW_12305 [Candidatus Helarchaeota archaeon]
MFVLNGTTLNIAALSFCKAVFYHASLPVLVEKTRVLNTILEISIFAKILQSRNEPLTLDVDGDAVIITQNGFTFRFKRNDDLNTYHDELVSLVHKNIANMFRGRAESVTTVSIGELLDVLETFSRFGKTIEIRAIDNILQIKQVEDADITKIMDVSITGNAITSYAIEYIYKALKYFNEHSRVSLWFTRSRPLLICLEDGLEYSVLIAPRIFPENDWNEDDDEYVDDWDDEYE